MVFCYNSDSHICISIEEVTMTYATVKEFFEMEYPDIVPYLGNTGGFWPEVQANTITNKRLALNVESLLKGRRWDSHVARASAALLAARILGKVANEE